MPSAGEGCIGGHSRSDFRHSHVAHDFRDHHFRGRYGRWPQCGYNHCTCGHLPQQHSPATLCLVEILKRRGVEFEWPLGHFRRVRLTRYHVVSQT
jgi:hypothetical protein